MGCSVNERARGSKVDIMFLRSFVDLNVQFVPVCHI